ncbi:MAG: hypothetical protein ACE5NM_13270 [Sedimentisphaerales bacterium]
MKKIRFKRLAAGEIIDEGCLEAWPKSPKLLRQMSSSAFQVIVFTLGVDAQWSKFISFRPRF